MLDNVYMGNGAEKFGFLMSVNACTVIFLTVFITSFTRKLHALPNMIIAGVIYAVGFGMIGIIKSFPLEYYQKLSSLYHYAKRGD